MGKVMMAYPNMRVTFATLREVALKHNWIVRMDIFDCGHYVTLLDMDGKKIHAATWRCDDDPKAQDGSSKIAQWLVDAGELAVSDFDGN